MNILLLSTCALNLVSSPRVPHYLSISMSITDPKSTDLNLTSRSVGQDSLPLYEDDQHGKSPGCYLVSTAYVPFSMSQYIAASVTEQYLSVLALVGHALAPDTTNTQIIIFLCVSGDIVVG